jgi:hypothetical protein
MDYLKAATSALNVFYAVILGEVLDMIPFQRINVIIY